MLPVTEVAVVLIYLYEKLNFSVRMFRKYVVCETWVQCLLQ